METSEGFQQICNHFYQFLEEEIVSVISKYLKKEKNVTVSTKELMMALGSGTNSNTQSRKKPKATSTNSKKPPPPPEGQCQWYFKTGSKKSNQYCCEPVLDDLPYCRDCIKSKKTVREELKKQGVDIDQLNLKGKKDKNITEAPPEEERKVEIYPYIREKNIFVEKNHRFIIVMNESKTSGYYIHFKLDDNDELKPMDEHDEKIASTLGFKEPPNEIDQEEILRLIRPESPSTVEEEEIPPETKKIIDNIPPMPKRFKKRS